MKKILMGAVMIGLVFGLGFFAGRHGFKFKQSHAAGAAARPVVELPPVGELPKSPQSEKSSGTMSLADAESAVTAARANISATSYEKLWAVAQSMRVEDIPELLRYMDGNSDRETRQMMLEILTKRWATFDPKAALAYASVIPMARLRDGTIAAAAAGWAEKDPDAASAWAQNLPAGGLRNVVM